MTTGRDPRFQRNALLLWFGQLVSVSGDALFIPCIAWLALEVTGSERSVGIVTFAVALPYLLFSALAGAWVDRADRKRVMIVSDLLRAGLLIGMPFVAMALGGPTFALLLVVAFLLGTFSTPFAPARDALLPDLVGGRSLTRWNAAFQTSSYIAMILGLLVGGVLLEAQGTGRAAADRILTVIGIDGATFVVSAVALAFIVVPRRDRPRRRRRGLWIDARAGLRYARRTPVVWGVLVLSACNNLALMGPAFVGPPLLLKQEFGKGPEHLVWFEGAMAVGMLVGALVLARFGKRWPVGKVWLWGMVLDGITYLPFVWVPSYELSVALITFHGFFIPMIVVARTTLLQRTVPDARLGKVFALVSMTVTGVTALSAAASGEIAYHLDARLLFGITGVFATLCGIVGFFWLSDRLDEVEART